MTRKRPRKVLVLDSMEKRVVLSHVAALPATESAEMAAPIEATTSLLSTSRPSRVSLNGSFQGTWTEDRSGVPVDAGVKTFLDGTGKLGGSLSTTAKGQLNGIGFALRGRVMGTVTLSNSEGSVTIQLTGPSQRAGRPLPSQFTFVTQGGTGKYANVQLRGTVKLSVMNASASQSSSGTFTLSLRSAPGRN